MRSASAHARALAITGGVCGPERPPAGAARRDRQTSALGRQAPRPAPGLPTFSVLIPAYNAASTLSATLDSVLAQRRNDWEAVIVDDGSTDDTVQIARAYARRDSRFRVFAEQNRGCAGARNTAAREARGEWLCPLDSDDEYEPTFLVSQAALIEAHPGYDIYSCNVWAEFPDGERELFRRSARTARTTSFGLEEMLRENQFCVITCFRRSMFERLGGFRENVHNEDWDFWLRAMATGATQIHNPEILAIYRQRRGSMTDDHIRNLESHRDILADLIASGGLGVSDLVMARRSWHHYKVAVERASLELRLLAGDYRRARTEYLRTFAGYRSVYKYLVGLLIVVASPRAYASLVRRRDRRGRARRV